MRSRWLHWFAAPLVAIGGWQGWENRDAIKSMIPAICDCGTTITAGPQVVPTPPPIVEPPPKPVEEVVVKTPDVAPAVVEPPKPPVVTCPTKFSSKLRGSEILTDMLNFIVRVTDDVGSNPEFAKCAVLALKQLADNDTTLLMPNNRLQELHTKAIYSLRRLNTHVTKEDNSKLSPWLAAIEKKLVSEPVGKAANCK